MNFWKKNKSALSFLAEILIPYRKMLFFFVIGNILGGGFSALMPYLAKIEIDQLMNRHIFSFQTLTFDAYKYFIIIVVIIFCISILEKLITQIHELITGKYERIFIKDLSVKVYRRMCNIRLGYYLNNRIKKIISDSYFTPEDILNKGKNTFSRLITNISFFLTFGIIASFVNIWIFLLILFSAIVSYVIGRIVKYIERMQDLQSNLGTERDSYVYKGQLSHYLDKLTTSGGQSYAIDSIAERLTEKAEQEDKRDKRTAAYRFASSFFGDAVEMALKIFIGYAVLKGTQSVGTMTMVIAYMTGLGTKLRNIFDLSEDFRDFRTKVGQFGILLGLTNEIKKEHAENTLSMPERLSFEQVSFMYPKSQSFELEYYETEIRELQLGMKKGDRWSRSPWNMDRLKYLEELRADIGTPNPQVVHSCNLKFEKGNVYGMVGKNGSGKTTLMYLLQDYFDDYEGKISINGEDIRSIQPTWFHKHIGVIHQEPYIIYGISLRDNLTLGVSRRIEDSELMDCLDRFHLGEKIRKTSSGLDVTVGERTGFSGGQEQLLVLIRILLQDRPILIFDEGTNQLDADNELMVMDELLKNKQDKIIIFITHRMTTMRRADYIYCLEEGLITNQGKHDELLAKDSIYARFWKKQVEE